MRAASGRTALVAVVRLEPREPTALVRKGLLYKITSRSV
jgi:hypothetical protein